MIIVTMILGILVLIICGLVIERERLDAYKADLVYTKSYGNNANCVKTETEGER